MISRKEPGRWRRGAPANRDDVPAAAMARVDDRRGYLVATAAVAILGALASTVLWWRDTVVEGWPMASYDAYTYYLPNLVYLQHSLTRGFGWLWNGLENCGQPMFGNGQIPALDPTAWLFLVVRPGVALALINTVALCLGPLGMLMFGRQLRLRPVAALTGAIALMAAPWTARFGFWQPTWFLADMWMPWVLAGTERALRKPEARSAVGIGVLLTLQVLAGAPQLTFFTYEVLALRCAWEVATRRRSSSWGGVLAVGCGMVLPLGLAAVKLLPALEINRVSIRQVPLSKDELLVGPWTPSWAQFRQQLSSPLSDGIVCQPWFVGLAALGAWARPRRRVGLFYLAAAVLYFALSFDGPVFALYRALPLGNLFRLPARFRSVTAMLTAVLVAFGVQAFVAAWRRWGWRLVMPLAAPLIGLAAFAALAHSLPGVWALSYTVGLVALGTIGAHISPRGVIGRYWGWTVPLWAALAVAFTVAAVRRLPEENASIPRTPNLFERAGALSTLATEMSPGERIYFFRDMERRLAQDWSVVPKLASLFGLRGVAGYEPLVSRRFADLLLALRGEAPFHSFALFEMGPEEPRNRAILNLLAARYVIGNTASATLTLGDPPLRELQRDGRFHVWENPAALPRAFFVPTAEVVADSATVLARLAAPDHDPRKVALIERPPADGILGSSGGRGSATIESDRSEELRIAVQADTPGFLFVSDQDYPGWSATVNGRATPILRADYAFRLVRVPAGDSTVVFRYRPRSVRWGVAISLATLLALLVACLMQRRRRVARQ